MTAPLTRFVPSPTGRLHLGHAHAAASVFGFAAEHEGTALLRIEDIDHTRCHAEFTDGIYEDLAWLGFNWPSPVRVQSEHYNDYAKVTIALIERGLAYPCTLSRTQLKSGKRTPRPDRFLHRETARICEKVRQAMRYKTPDLPFAIRLNLEAALKRVPDRLSYQDTGAQLNAWPSLQSWANSTRPDPVIARRDISASYHIAVTHDDHIQDITHIVRGADFIDQTPLHVLIQHLMGWNTPIYHHHALITDAAGHKLSKTARDQTIQSLRISGTPPADVLSSAKAAL